MRITKLSIKNYKNLQDFSWELNADYPVAVIVGKNGSGKTNLLEAIITIFQDLQLYREESKNNSLPKFKFELEYQHGEDNENTISIKNNDKFEITQNGEGVSLSRLETLRQDASQGKDILPKTIFVYYAGNTTRLQDLTNKSVSQYERLLIDIAYNRRSDFQYSLTQPLFYYDLPHHKIAFLTLCLSSLDSIKNDFLEDELGVTDLDSVSFTITRPDWKRHSTSASDIENFWDAPVFLKRILGILRETANLEESKGSGEITFEILGNELKEKFAEFSSEKDFFQQLSNLTLAKYLTNIEIKVIKKDMETPIKFADLSEGEWQRIAIRGAMEIFRGEEALFLLDEPDTFAHPRWQWDFVPDLKEAIGENKNMQAIFITHSPLVLSSVEKNAFFMEAGQIHILQENFGQDANMSLAKMDVNPQMEQVVNDFQRYYSLIKDGQGETEKALAERARLEDIYGLNHEKFDSADIMLSFYK